MDGPRGVLHGNSGRAPKHRTSDLVPSRIVQLWREKYVGFNDQHFTEKLAEVEGLRLSRQTVRRMLRSAGIASVRSRRPCKHRRRRDRRAQAGQMILWDGSRHPWLEDRGPSLCLIGAIDDATGELLPGAHFVEQECSVGYLRVLRDIVTTRASVERVHGPPRHAAAQRQELVPVGAARRPTAANAGEACARRPRDPGALRFEPAGEGSRRTAVGDASGPSRFRASPRRSA